MSATEKKLATRLLEQPVWLDQIGGCIFCHVVLRSQHGVKYPADHKADCPYMMAKEILGAGGRHAPVPDMRFCPECRGYLHYTPDNPKTECFCSALGCTYVRPRKANP